MVMSRMNMSNPGTRREMISTEKIVKTLQVAICIYIVRPKNLLFPHAQYWTSGHESENETSYVIGRGFANLCCLRSGDWAFVFRLSGYAMGLLGCR